MRCTLAATALLFVAPLGFAEDFPHVLVKTEKLTFTLYDADAKKGFYRGTRFDHAGVFGHVEFAGHKIFGPWKGSQNPTNHDDIVGPCDEFGIDSPLGYTDAKVGETFLKIGVGELEKPKEAKYSFANKYKVAALPERKYEVDTRVGRPAYVWQTTQKANGYGYEFTKRLSTQEQGQTIRIEYRLKNTGEKPIVTDFYNHNFFNIDGDPVGPGYSFAFNFAPKVQEPTGKFSELVEVKDKTFRFKDKLPSGDFVMAELTGFDPKAVDPVTFEMVHAPSGVTVEVTHTYPLSKLNVWGIKTTICPEPYMAIDLKSGQVTNWIIEYRFRHNPPKKK